MSEHEWRYWWPSRGETAEDWRPLIAHGHRIAGYVAEEIAERDWHHFSDKEWTSAELMVVDPDGRQSRFAVSVETVHMFRAVAK